MDRRRQGATAEAAARDYLVAQGLEILIENYRCRLGELDLVLLDRGVLAIVEVRLRGHSQFGGASASIDRFKRERIVRATRHLLVTRRELRSLPIRFDVVALDAAKNKAMSVEWIRGAFEADH